MAVKRIEDLDIEHRGLVTAIVGNTDDFFIDNDLCRYNFEIELYLYLKIKGYDFIYFYSRESGAQLYTYDGPEAIEWLFPSDDSHSSGHDGSSTDGRPFGRRRRFRSNTASTDLISSDVRMGRTYWYRQSLGDTALTSAIIEILDNKVHRSIICFTSTALQLSIQGFIPALKRIKSNMAASRSHNRLLILYENVMQPYCS